MNMDSANVYLLFTFLCSIQLVYSKSFTIDYDNNCFLKDGEPFRYISGSFHYFRVPRFYWRDRLMKMKAGGLNTVQTYIAWNFHEPVHGQYKFDGDADLVSFIQMANNVGLLVIIRAGPYICAEWEFGGYPAWLLNDSSITLRSSKDKRYLEAVETWMSVVLPKLKPLLYTNDGPVISVQVENEYGSSLICDLDYLRYLEQLFRRYLGNDVILFTVDIHRSFFFACGSIPSLYATVDFGPDVDPESAFGVMRKFTPKGPLVNSEFYTGWIDYWGTKHQVKDASKVSKSLDKILSMNASVNFYMYEGGTNYGFMSGATDWLLYRPMPTSYDYDAPLTESGDVGTKFHVLRKTIAKHTKVPKIPIPGNTTKFALGKVHMTRLSRFIDALQKLSPRGPIKSLFPLTMERIGHNYGFVLYRTEIPKKFASSDVVLDIPILPRDRAIFFVGNIRQATLFRATVQSRVNLRVKTSLQLDILVENMGRINAGLKLIDPKGIIGNVSINGTELTNWQMYPIDLQNFVSEFTSSGFSLPFPEKNLDDSSGLIDTFSPSFYYGEIPLPSLNGSVFDSFLHLPGWNKGQAFINGFNLGRYWPAVGPQSTLFAPANVLLLKRSSASLVLLELDGAPCDIEETCFADFIDYPILNAPVRPL